jgi:hypothetical protein
MISVLGYTPAGIRRPDGPWSRAGGFGEDIKLLILPGFESRFVQHTAKSLYAIG